MLILHLNKFILLFLLIGSFGFSKGYARLTGDDVKELSDRYAQFQGGNISQLKQQPCKAVQFVYHLQQELMKSQDSAHSKKLAAQIAAVIAEGAGVGGINAQRSATEDERKILFGALSQALSKGAEDIENVKDFPLTGHQRVVQSIHKLSRKLNKESQAPRPQIYARGKVSKDPSPPSYDFIHDENSYKSFRNAFFWTFLETDLTYLKLRDNNKDILKGFENHFKEKIKDFSFAGQYDFTCISLNLI